MRGRDLWFQTCGDYGLSLRRAGGDSDLTFENLDPAIEVETCRGTLAAFPFGAHAIPVAHHCVNVLLGEAQGCSTLD